MEPLTVLSYKDEDMPKKIAVYKALCGAETCLLLFYMHRDKPYTIILPARPSPLCGLVDLEHAKIIARIVRDLGIASAFLPACKVSSKLMKRTIRETIETLIGLGLIDEVL